MTSKDMTSKDMTSNDMTSNQPCNKQSILAFTWYHEHDYDKLIEVSRNQEGLKESYQHWLVDARRAFLKYKNMGFEPTRVYLDVEEYVSWCELRERPVNQKSREMFKEIKRQEFYRQIDQDQPHNDR